MPSSKIVYYIDANIFIDVIEERKNIFGKDIATPAYKLFYDSVICKFYMAISTWSLKELSKKTDPNDLKAFFALAKKKIIPIKYNEEDILEAKKKSKDNSDDALHIILAEKHKVDCIVTRNVDHFQEIGTKLPIKKPEWLI